MFVDAAPDDEIVLETPSWVVRQLLTYEASKKHCRHSGWCTRHKDDFDSYIRQGKLFIFRKRGKRRASYQLFIRENGITEFKHKGNEHADIWKFQEEQVELTGWLKVRVKTQDQQIASLDTVSRAFAELGDAARAFGSSIQDIGRFYGQFDGLREIDAWESFGGVRDGDVLFDHQSNAIWTYREGVWAMPTPIDEKEPRQREDHKPNKGTNSGALHNGRLVNGLRKMQGSKW